MPDVDRTPIVVTCAVIVDGGSVLAARRPAGKSLGGKWEFPGGKLDDGEGPEACLIREIREELQCSIRPTGRLTPVEHAYPDFTIRLLPFVAEISEGEPVPLEHDRIEWIPFARLMDLDWADADVPVCREVLLRFADGRC